MLPLPDYLWKSLWLSLKYNIVKGLLPLHFSYLCYPKTIYQGGQHSSSRIPRHNLLNADFFNCKRDLEPRPSGRCLCGCWSPPKARSHLSPVLTGDLTPLSACSSPLAMENDQMGITSPTLPGSQRDLKMHGATSLPEPLALVALPEQCDSSGIGCEHRPPSARCCINSMNS